MTKNLIYIKNLYKAFEVEWVLQNINLKVQKGQRVVICGPSGSGKSTLLRCINGLEAYDRGSITVIGHIVEEKNYHAIRGKTAMLFQSFNLFPHLTVVENCTLAQRMVQRKTHEEAEVMASIYLKKVQMEKFGHKYPIELSGGQQQRVAIARSLCLEPEIILFDEPTSALDPEMIQEVLDVMLELGHSGMTMVCVTHEMTFARRFADVMIFMADGKIIDRASPQAFFNSPQHKRTQQFLEKITAN